MFIFNSSIISVCVNCWSPYQWSFWANSCRLIGLGQVITAVKQTILLLVGEITRKSGVVRRRDLKSGDFVFEQCLLSSVQICSSKYFKEYKTIQKFLFQHMTPPPQHLSWVVGLHSPKNLKDDVPWAVPWFAVVLFQRTSQNTAGTTLVCGYPTHTTVPSTLTAATEILCWGRISTNVRTLSCLTGTPSSVPM